MIQGNDRGAGAKHSLYGHYGTTKGVFSSEDIIAIPEIYEKGERTEKMRGNVKLAVYKLAVEGNKRYTVVNEIKKDGEVFNDFYTNKKVLSQTPQMPNGDTLESARTNELNTLSGAKLLKNIEKSKENPYYFGYRRYRRIPRFFTLVMPG